MNNRSRRLCRDLEALGFYRDETHANGAVIYRHANDPEDFVKVQPGMSDNGRTAALRLANKIADTGWSGPNMSPTIKERATITRRKSKVEREREAAARRERAEAAEELHSGARRAPTSREASDWGWDQPEALKQAGFMLASHGFTNEECGAALRKLLASGARCPVRAIRAMTDTQITDLHRRVA